MVNNSLVVLPGLQNYVTGLIIILLFVSQQKTPRLFEIATLKYTRYGAKCQQDTNMSFNVF